MKKAPLSKGSEHAAVLRTSLYYIGSVRSWQAEQIPHLMAAAALSLRRPRVAEFSYVQKSATMIK
jgi:hypothetical protein